MALEILPDARALRSSRRERALAQMEANDIDILVLGRQANVRYVTGAPQLWVAGTRPFGPICEVVRSTGEIYLNSTWDEGIPDEIPHDHLYGRGHRAAGRNRFADTDIRTATADGVPERRTGRRRAGASGRAADQDTGRDRGVARGSRGRRAGA